MEYATIIAVVLLVVGVLISIIRMTIKDNNKYSPDLSNINFTEHKHKGTFASTNVGLGKSYDIRDATIKDQGRRRQNNTQKNDDSLLYAAAVASSSDSSSASSSSSSSSSSSDSGGCGGGGGD